MFINDRFVADPLRNEVIDRQTGKVMHVEPRIMKLLCLLTEHQGEAVSRKMIVKEIWNDYPGGDEGLNQAISILRKLLDDDKKKIIETLPKTGYCFHGTIDHEQIAPGRKPSRVIYVAAALFLLFIITMVLKRYHDYYGNDKTVPGTLSHEESARAFKIDAAGKLDSKENGQLDSQEKGQIDSKENGNAHLH